MTLQLLWSFGDANSETRKEEEVLGGARYQLLRPLLMAGGSFTLSPAVRLSVVIKFPLESSNIHGLETTQKLLFLVCSFYLFPISQPHITYCEPVVKDSIRVLKKTAQI